jgi:lysophospholipase L1-like esterase
MSLPTLRSLTVPSRRKRLAFSLILAVGMVLLMEGGLRLLAAGSRSIDALLAAEPARQAVRDRSLGWRGNPDYPEHDPLGYRNSSVPGHVAMVALGDSQTYGSQVRREEAWPEQFERLGAGSVYNMGFPGWGPAHELLVLDEALSLRPELVVATVYLGNDLVDAFTSVYDGGRLRELRSRDEEARAAFAAAEEAEPFDGDLLAHQDSDGLGERRGGGRAPGSLADLITMHSKLFGLGRAVTRAYDQHREWLDGRGQPPDADDGVLAVSNGRFSTLLTPGYRAQAVDLDDPRVAEGLRLTVDVLDAMRERTEDSGARFAVVLIPTKELAVSDLAGDVLPSIPPIYAELVEDEQAAIARLRALLAARRIASVDTLPALRALVLLGRLPYSATKDGHLSPDGQRSVAEQLRASLAGGQPSS